MEVVLKWVQFMKSKRYSWTGDSRQDFNIFTDLSPKAGKTALLNAVSSGDSRQLPILANKVH